MTFDQIKYFMAVVEYGNFSKAAEYLYISQSSLSKQIKSLEDELKNRLFIRNGIRIELTSAGQLFLEFAKDTIDAYRDFLNQASYNGGHCTLRVGTLPLLLEYSFMDIISHFQMQYEHVLLSLIEDTQSGLMKMLDNRLIDAAIARSDFLSPKNYRIVPSHQDVLCVVCSRNHHLAEKEELSLGDLMNESMILLGEDSSIYRLIREACLQYGFKPNIVFTSNRHTHLLGMIQQESEMISILPNKMIEHNLDSGIAIIEMKEKIYTTTSLILDKRNNENPYLNEFSNWWRTKAAYKSFEDIVERITV